MNNISIPRQLALLLMKIIHDNQADCIGLVIQDKHGNFLCPVLNQNFEPDPIKLSELTVDAIDAYEAQKYRIHSLFCTQNATELVQNALQQGPESLRTIISISLNIKGVLEICAFQKNTNSWRSIPISLDSSAK